MSNNEILWGDRELARIWRPRTPSQWAALTVNARLVLHGGAAGAYKSETLVINAIRYRRRPLAKSVIFRRTKPELEQLIERARGIYQQLGARYSGTSRTFRFPSGATVKFDYMEKESHEARQYSQEYDFIGFDESTRMKNGMNRVRFMFSRNRSKDPYLADRLRIHLATNPGGPGNNDHKHVFIGSRCCHCALHRKKGWLPGARLPGKIYYDATWPGGDPLSEPGLPPISTVFIPGKLDEAGILGISYYAGLRTLTAALQKALLSGCWDITEGQYFDIWNEDEMVVNRKLITDQWWWPHWVSMDYGFAGSAASAHLHCKSPAFEIKLIDGRVKKFPNGRIYTIAECTEKHMLAADFADKINRLWNVGGRKISAWYASPDLWNQTGDGHTRAHQMMDKAKINLTRASNDRVGGAMLMYQLLRDDRWKIGDNCPLAAQSIPWAVHDTEEGGNPDDVLKVTGVLLDDVYDDIRYGMYSHIGQAEKPGDVDLVDAVTSEDPTGAMIQYRQAEEKQNKTDEPIFMQGTGRRRRGSD
jgi:hypothetical protein